MANGRSGRHGKGRRRAIIVSHTHWDREWYRPFQEFRLALVEVLDELFDALDAGGGPPMALLDGQTVLLDDYLELRPARREAAWRYGVKGRLIVGPWYVQPDEFLVSGEALVRNLLRGQRDATAYGGIMSVGYLADQFGHIAQLPQILRGFGIESAVFWRGRARDAGGSEFWWEAPDGSRVLGVHLSDGYGNAAWLPLEHRALARRIEELYDTLTTTATTTTRLLMNGMDHQRLQVGLAAALVDAAPFLGTDLDVEIGSLSTYIDAVRDESLPVERGEYRSSRSTPLLPGVLSTRMHLKQRNVRLQTLLEREAEPWSALAATLDLLPHGYPLAELGLAWDYLLQNHPHDSICGCTIDQVAHEMETRFDWAAQIANRVTVTATSRLAAAVRTRPPWQRLARAVPRATVASEAEKSWRPAEGSLPDDVALVTFNAAEVERTDRVRVRITLPGRGADYEVVDESGAAVPHRWLGEHGEASTTMEMAASEVPGAETVIAQIPGDRVMEMGVHDARVSLEGDAVVADLTLGEQSVLSRGEIEDAVRFTERLIADARPARAVLRIHRSTRLELEYLAREIPAHGYATVWLRKRQVPLEDEAGAGTGSVPRLTTEMFELHIDALTGALQVVDRRDGHTYENGNVFVDEGDAGDTYTYAPPGRDQVVRGPAAPPRITVEHDPLGVTVQVALEMRVPAALTAARARRSPTAVVLPVVSTIQLTDGVPRIDITTTVQNCAEDHRLRVSFQAPLASDHVHVEDAFTVTRRAIGAPPGGPEWAEQPAATGPQQGFLALHGPWNQGEGSGALLLVNQGLPEYEARHTAEGGTEVLLTLLRCVGWLSREDLATRKGHAGPGLATPEAQCPGPFTASYSLLPHPGAWRDAIPLARAAGIPLRAVAVILSDEVEVAPLPSRASFVRIDPPGVAITALKGAQDGDGFILRLCNLTGAAIESAALAVDASMPRSSVHTVSLAEALNEGLPRGDVGAGEKRLSLRIGQDGIVTLRLVPHTAAAPSTVARETAER